MSVLHSHAGSPHTGTLNSHFNSGSVTLERMQQQDYTAYSPNLSSLANRNLTYTGFDGQSYRLPQSAIEQRSLSRNGPKPTTSNHRGIFFTLSNFNNICIAAHTNETEGALQNVCLCCQSMIHFWYIAT